MTPEDQLYYETYFELFASDGWKQFVSEIQDILDGHRIEDIKDEKHLSYVKGQREAYHRVTRFAGGIKRSYDIIQEKLEHDS